MRFRRQIIGLIFGCFALVTQGQDCDSPITLCSEVNQTADSSQFVGAFNQGCLDVPNSMFFEFTTNNNVGNPSAFTPYEVEALITANDCTDAGVPLNVSAAVFQPVDPNTPCGALSEIATCISDQNTLTLNSGTLQPNTTYFIVVGIDSTTNDFSCDLDVVLTGAPLEIDACCDANISLGLSTSLNVFGVTPVNGNDNYVWQPAESLDNFLSSNPTASPEFTTIYTVEGNVGDCLVSDAVTVTVGDAVTVKNTFSPNGDGINDTWTINRIENFDSALITVFDRWGQEVYKTIGYTTPWDGTNEGRKLATGTYYYVIELNSLEVTSEPLVGFVVILN